MQITECHRIFLVIRNTQGLSPTLSLAPWLPQESQRVTVSSKVEVLNKCYVTISYCTSDGGKWT